MSESTQSSKKSSDTPKMSGPPAISEAEQRKLQKCFIAGEQKISGNVIITFGGPRGCAFGQQGNVARECV